MQEWIRKQIAAKKAIKPILIESKQSHESGIYLFERVDENGIHWFYCGQAVDIYKRTISHYTGWEHLDQSLRKRGFYSQDNPQGWTFKVLEYCERENLDELEQFYILDNMRQGKQAYNVTAGKQGQGKETFDTRKPSRGYREGVKQGERNVIKKIAHLFDLHLKAVPKADKPSKIALNALDKFNEIIGGDDNHDK